MYTNGMKIKMVKPVGGVDFVGEVFTITNILNGGMIEFGLVNDVGFGMGLMSFKECAEYFEPVVDKPKKQPWSKWENARYISTGSFACIPAIVLCRNNGRDVQVKVILNHILDGKAVSESAKSSARCNVEYDKFNYDTGVQIACTRAMKKLWSNREKAMLNEM